MGHVLNPREAKKMDEPIKVTVKTEGAGSEVVKAIHASKSYVGSAFLSLLFYYVGFFLIGLICNLVFLSQSNESKRISGVSPSGRGCLLVLLWVHLILPAIGILLFLLLGGWAAGGL